MRVDGVDSNAAICKLWCDFVSEAKMNHGKKQFTDDQMKWFNMTDKIFQEMEKMGMTCNDVITKKGQEMKDERAWPSDDDEEMLG